jgi:hypothetical protein
MTRGTRHQTDGFGQFSTGRLSCRPHHRAQGSGGGDPGNHLASITTSARSATVSQARAMSPSRQRSSTASSPISPLAIRPMRSRWRASSSPIRTGRRCCAIPRPPSTRSAMLARSASSVSASAAASPMPPRQNCQGGRLLRRRHRSFRRRQTEGADAVAFRRKGCGHSARRYRDHRRKTARRRNPRLS